MRTYIVSLTSGHTLRIRATSSLAATAKAMEWAAEHAPEAWAEAVIPMGR